MLTKIASNSSLKLKSSQVPKVNIGKTVTTTTRNFSATNKVNRNFGVFANFSKSNSKTSLIQPVKIFSAPRFQFSTEEEEYTPKTYSRRPQRQFDTNLLLLRSQKEINEHQVKSLFGPNELKEIQVLKDPNGKFLGATFVEFASNDDAGKAMSFFRRVPREGEDSMLAVRPAQLSERELSFEQSSSPSKVVVIKRLPYSTSEDEVAKLLDGINFQAVTVGNGVAIVKFATPQDAEKALAKNGTEFARRSIIVDTGLDIDFNYHAARPIKVLRIRGAPSSAKEQEFREFFAPAEVTKVDFTYRDGISGRQVPGDVFVEFQSNEHLQQALKKDRQNLGERYLQLFRSSARERRNRLTAQFPRNNSFGQEGGQGEF